MDKVIVGMAAALGIIAILIILMAIGAGTTVTNMDFELKNTSTDIDSTDGCQPRTYIQTPGGKFHSCPALVTTSAALTDINGFPACVEMYRSDNDEPYATTYDFVLKPNSTGYITMEYDFGTNERPEPEFFVELAKSSDIHRLAGDGTSWIFVPTNHTSLSVSVAPENVAIVDPTALKVTYTIETKNTKQEEIGSTYLINIYQVCTGQLITIGEEPYAGRLAWD